MEKPMVVAAYIRVSTDEQTDYSPSVQLEEIQAYAKKNEMIIPENYVFTDEGISGRTARKRPAFMEMIQLARKKGSPIQAILVHKFDRFARSKEDSVLYKALLKRDGIKVLSVREPVPEDSKFAVIYESMLEAMAEYYSLNLAEEVKKTMQKKAALGEYQAVAPFGYKNKNKSLEIIPEEAVIIQYLFEQYGIHGKPVTALARELNALGVHTHHGNPMEPRSVQYFLLNPVYAGYARWNPAGHTNRNFFHPSLIIAKSTHPPIVQKDLFDLVQKRYLIEKGQKATPVRTSPAESHWLCGIIKCSACGRNLVISKRQKNGRFTMQCSGYTHSQCSVSHSISSARLLPSIDSAIASLLEKMGPHSYQAVIKKEVSEKAAHPYKEEIARLEQRLVRLKESYLSGADSLEEYQQAKGILLSTLASMKQHSKQQAGHKKNTETYLGAIHMLLSPDVPLTEKKETGARIFTKIIYQKETGALLFYLRIPHLLPFPETNKER